MTLATELVQRLRQVPELIKLAERRVTQLSNLADDLVITTKELRTLKVVTEPTLVYLLPKEGVMMAESRRVARGARETIIWQPMWPVPTGTWVVAVGPAMVRDVFVGNQAQSCLNFQGNVCQFKDEATVGVQIRVVLESPTESSYQRA